MSEPKKPVSLTRRGFLKTTAAVAGASALAGGAGLTALAAQEPAAGEPEEQFFMNECRGNCACYCPMRVKVREGKVVSAMPPEYPTEEDSDLYKRACLKGMSNPQRLYDPDRLKYPMRRVEGTERGAGEWERITWDEAIALVAEKFNAARAEYGANSIAHWYGYGSFGILNGNNSAAINIGIARFRFRFGITVLDSGADRSGMSYAPLLGLVNSTDDGILESKTIFVWGGNPGEAQLNEWHWVVEAKRRGATLVTIDPQFTQAAAHSDKYVPVIPGTDGAVMLGMCNHIMDNGLVDEAYLKADSVAPFLLKEDGTYLRESDLTGVAPAEGEASPIIVWDADADAYGTANAVANPAIYGEYEVEGRTCKTTLQHVRESVAEWTPEKASEISGVPAEDIVWMAERFATDKPARVLTFYGLSHHGNSRHTYKDLALLIALTGNCGMIGGGGSWCTYGVQSQNYLLCYPEVMEGIPLSSVGMALPRILREGSIAGMPVTIRCLWFANGNPLANESGRAELVEAVKSIDFVVCQDTCMTETARYSDVVLPVPHSYEVEDYNPVLGLSPWAKPVQKCVEPAFECRTDMDIYRALSAAMGVDDLYPLSDEEYLRQSLLTPANIELGATYDDIKQGELGPKLIAQPIVAGKAGTLKTATGRLQFYLESVTSRANLGDAIDLDVERVPTFQNPYEAYKANPLIETYPLMGCSEHRKYTLHTQYGHTPWLRELDPEPVLKINADDAAARGIEAGDYVRVFNDRGYAVIRARLTQGIMPGVVCIPHGWQSDQFVEGNTQDLTSTALSQIDGNSSFYDFLCEVEKWEGSVA